MAEEVQTEKKKKVGRPPKVAVPIHETDEFKAAVAAAASKAAADILATLQTAQGAQPRQGDESFAEKLGLAIAQLSSQGVGRAKPVDPALLAERERARKTMTDLIVKARMDGETPIYELRNKVYLDEVLVDPVGIDPATKEQRPTRIDWPGVPNEAMAPVNEVAQGIHKAFSESIGTVVIEHSKHIKHQQMGVTAGGLVVHGAGHALRPMQVGNGQPTNETTEGLRVHGRGGRGGKQKEINVLGTVASPARVGAV